MIDLASFKNVRLHGGFVITEIEFTKAPMVDALEREALAQTRIVGQKFHLIISGALSEREVSISLYHEILEAATVAASVRHKVSWSLTKVILKTRRKPLMRNLEMLHRKT